MPEQAQIATLLIALGLLFLAGLAADWIGRRTRLPRVTLLLACGLIVGRPGLNLVPPEAQALYDFLSVTALTMVAFLLGSSLTRDTLARHGRAILLISLSMVVVCALVVTGGLWLLGLPVQAALLLGAIATATDPAATQDAIRQSGAEGPFVDRLRGIVAIDDAWGLIAFSLAAVLALALTGTTGTNQLARAAWEIGGALALGLAIGWPAAILTGRVQEGEPLLVEALGVTFLTAGIAIWAGVSFLLAGMTAGAVVANVARHHDRAFHEIEHIQWPFMLLFFILAGASLELDQLRQAGLIGAGYIAARLAGRVLGGWFGASLARTSRRERRWYGVALLPQAGVAVGMALVAARDFPELGGLILTVTVGTTVAFELIGPALTLIALRRTAR
ncbi:cation:proton antiporter [Roseovarius aestuariivivens]|uniref:cation:proton antiporter n=1 Tax=Roseovarius aestuariivivens TaxID=1888910 RepID=UPI00108168E4|nr:cation:proton antiporter [Roseovarius aestuariivivens]